MFSSVCRPPTSLSVLEDLSPISQKLLAFLRSFLSGLPSNHCAVWIDHEPICWPFLTSFLVSFALDLSGLYQHTIDLFLSSSMVRFLPWIFSNFWPFIDNFHHSSRPVSVFDAPLYTPTATVTWQAHQLFSQYRVVTDISHVWFRSDYNL